MVRDALVGVDVGTTFIKAVAYTSELIALGRAKVRTPWTATVTGAEAHPDELADSAIEAIELALNAADDVTRVVAVGVTGMGETGVLVDRRDQPLFPSIVWHDHRGREQAERLEGDLGDFELRAGRRPSELCSLVKWRWLNDAFPEATHAVRWLSVAEWVVHRLGGRPASEASLASRTGAIDVRRGAPFDEALDWAGAPRSWIADLVPAGVPAGRVETGPRPIIGSVTTVAGLDSYASMLAVAADDPGTIFVSCGTSGAAVRVLDRPISNEDVARAVSSDLTIDRYLDDVRLAVLGATPCGLILQPLHDLLGPPPETRRSSRDGPDLGVGSDGSVWIHHIRSGVTPGEVWRRAYEAVADGQGRRVHELERFGARPGRLVAAGGWIEHAGLRDALEHRVGPAWRVGADETAARGAAMLARSALER